MRLFQRLALWFESRWVTPAYSGWVLLGVALFFFGAATNTMAGWLYVISGVMMAMLSVSSILPQRALQGLKATRKPLHPVSAGTALLVEVVLENETSQPKSLVQVKDFIPVGFGAMPTVAIATLLPQQPHRWLYEIPTHQRGIYHWQTIQLRTAVPLGLFWCSREQQAKAKAIVYPQLLPLSQCPLIDALGAELGVQWQRDQTANAGNEGLTRALRPYRWGDPTRLIHWRTSARYGSLRIRELEKFTSSQEVVIALNTATPWSPDRFEQAVIAAATLYNYALQRGMASRFWSPQTHFIQDKIPVLTTLAGIAPELKHKPHPLPTQPVIWLTPELTQPLPLGSRAIVFPTKTAAHSSVAPNLSVPGVIIDANEPLQQQLQCSPAAGTPFI
jgi:uncharacterized protein (DUF58 family)